MNAPRTLRFTVAQLRMINAALAIWEAEDHDDFPDYSQGVMDRTRAIVWAALGDEVPA